jgi:hypothetical protein
MGALRKRQDIEAVEKMLNRRTGDLGAVALQLIPTAAADDSVQNPLTAIPGFPEGLSVVLFSHTDLLSGPLEGPFCLHGGS